MRSPRAMCSSTTAAARSGLADLVEEVESPAGRPAVERAGERAQGPHDAHPEVGAGGRDHAGGERRGVEAVVGGEDEVGVEGPLLLEGWRLARQHASVVGGVTQRRMRIQRGAAVPEPVQRRHQRGHERDHREGVVEALGLVEVEQGKEPEGTGGQSQTGVELGERRGTRRGDGGQGGQHRGSQPTPGGEAIGEGRPFVGLRERAEEQEVHHVLERAGGGQLDRRELAVVEEALGAADVADRRVGDDQALESGRGSGRGGGRVGRGGGGGAGRSGGARGSSGGRVHAPVVPRPPREINLDYRQR